MASSRQVRNRFLIFVSLTFSLLPLIAQSSPEQHGKGDEWLSWDSDTKRNYISEFIKAQRSVDPSEAPQRPFIAGDTKRSSRLDFNAYATAVSDFYSFHPEYRSITLSNLLTRLNDYDYGALEKKVDGEMEGDLLARFDVASGRYRVLTLGLPLPFHREYVRLLLDRYGIESHAIAGCAFSESAGAFARAYNSVSQEAAKRKFGRDVFAECLEDAYKGWAAAKRKRR